MSFLLGAFGTHCTPTLCQKLSSLAEQRANARVMQVSIDQGIIIAGGNDYACEDHNRIMPLFANSGLMIGKIFNRDTYESVDFDEQLTRSIINNPHLMTKKCWGRYVGVLFDKTKQTITLVRDPQGLSTIFYCNSVDGIIFASDMKLLYDALEIKPSLDLNYFAEHLLHTNHALPTTPFKDIQELLPGMGLMATVNGEWSQDFLWDVASIKSPFINDTHAFEEELLVTLKSCVKAWTSDASGVCVELSGGTDSSGLMLLLREVLLPDKALTAVNFIDSKTPSSNEIEFAQEIADACQASLHFIDMQTVSLLDFLPHHFFPNKPSTIFLSYKIRQQIHEYAQHNHCDIIMNGQGGDHVFCAPQPTTALMDYWLDHGLAGITKPLRELSSVHRTPWTSLIYESFKGIIHYYRGIKYEELQLAPYFDKHFFSEFTKHDLYLNELLKNFYPSKAAHIESFYHAISYCERDQFPMIITHPLLSQPVIELALKIPAYQSFADGYDRIFFRRAVDKTKKTKALWRRIKGQTTGSMAKQCAYHADDIKSIIMDGKLFKSGMLDKPWLTGELAKIRHGYVENLWPILHLLTSELWINQWNL